MRFLNTNQHFLARLKIDLHKRESCQERCYKHIPFYSKALHSALGGYGLTVHSRDGQTKQTGDLERQHRYLVHA